MALSSTRRSPSGVTAKPCGGYVSPSIFLLPSCSGRSPKVEWTHCRFVAFVPSGGTSLRFSCDGASGGAAVGGGAGATAVSAGAAGTAACNGASSPAPMLGAGDEVALTPDSERAPKKNSNHIAAAATAMPIQVRRFIAMFSLRLPMLSPSSSELSGLLATSTSQRPSSGSPSRSDPRSAGCGNSGVQPVLQLRHS